MRDHLWFALEKKILQEILRDISRTGGVLGFGMSVHRLQFHRPDFRNALRSLCILGHHPLPGRLGALDEKLPQVVNPDILQLGFREGDEIDATRQWRHLLCFLG